MSLVAQGKFTLKRMDKFHAKCREGCSSKKRFDRSFNVNVHHIASQASLKQEKRHSLRDEDIASVIHGGKLRLDKCTESSGRLEIAVEAVVKEFEWIENSAQQGVIRKVEAKVQIRVVVRESAPKSFVVTAYFVEPIEDSEVLPEVNREIWT